MLNNSQLWLLRGATVVMAVLFGLSVTLLVWASTLAVAIAPGTLSWQGIVDVVSAFILVILGAVLTVRANALVGRSTHRLAYGVATLLVPLMLVGMWLNARRLLWDVLLGGLAWRSWLLLYALPAAIAVWRPQRRRSDSPAAKG
jgi:fumarate reductase subunit C